MNQITYQETNDNNAAAIEEWVRLPKSGKRLFGLTRSTLNELILPCPRNGNRPPVKSVVLKRRDAVRGIRLINRASLLQYLDQLAVQGGSAR